MGGNRGSLRATKGPWRRARVALVGAVCTAATLVSAGLTAGVTAVPAAASVGAWSVVASPNPAGSPSSILEAISCPAGAGGTQCTAVGQSAGSTVGQTLVETWNGSSWSIVPSPDAAGAASSVLWDVSCPTTVSCTAVGDSTTVTTNLALIESWNGVTWSVVPSPNPSGATGSVLYGVSCTGPTSCEAVGGSWVGSDYTTLVESWNGTTWSVVASPNPVGANNSFLQDVSCTGATSCMAVGYSDTSALAETWNGTTWSISPTPTGGSLSGVTCTGPGFCVAVGATEQGIIGRTEVDTWNGTSWSPVSSPNPSGSLTSALDEVSCLSATSCTAVGSGNGPLVEAWNGSSWSIVPSAAPSGSSGDQLWGASCAGATTCAAVGQATVGGVTQTLVESGAAPTPVTITSAGFDAFTQGVAEQFAVTTTGSPVASITESGTLPPGVSFADNGTGTALLSGTATQSGTFPVTVTAQNPYEPAVSQSFTLVVNPPSTNWTSLSPGTNPGGLAGASAAYDPTTGQLVLFGGTGSGGSPLNGTWSWTGTTWTPLSPAASPPARTGASLAYDPAMGQLVLFGGTGAAGTPLADTWTWNGTTWTPLSPAASPPARSGGSLSNDPMTGQLVLFGGTGAAGTPLADTWTWNGTTWTPLSPAASPPARTGASQTYDPAMGQLVLFGGTGAAGTPLADTWTWNGTTWTPLSPAASPPARSSAALVFDPPAEQLVLFGGTGTGGSPLGDTWAWTGATWNAVPTASAPSARSGAATDYDPGTSQLLLVGGTAGSAPLADTWTYAPLPPVAPAAPSIGSVVGGNASAVVNFNPPPTDGGAAVTSYSVTATDLTTPTNGGQTATGTSSPVTVPGLVNGDTYTFAVKATNSAGTGTASSASSSVVPATTPGAPTLTNAVAGNASAVVSFTPPSSNGGSPVTSFTVTATDLTTPGNGGQTATGSASPITVPGLVDGDTYTLVVSATNAVGAGPASAASTGVVPESVPGAPTIGTATRANASASVSFTPPASDGGSSITSFTVTATDLTTPANGGQTATGTSSPITVTGLTNGDTYDFTVDATNAIGTGPSSAASNSVVPVVPIGITSVSPGLLAIGASGSFTVSGAGFVSGATVKVTGPSTTVTDTVSSVVVTATTVTATLKSTTATLPGSYSVTVTDPDTTTSTCSGCLTVVAAPTVTSMTPSVGAKGAVRTITVTGTGFATGATLVVPTGTFVTNTAVVSPTTITSSLHIDATATPGSGLSVGVTDPAAAGYGKGSAPLFSILAAATAPAAPTIGTPTVGNASAVVPFVSPANDGGSTVTSFKVVATDLTTPANGGQTATGSASPITVPGLTNGDTYTFTVTATNTVGTGPASAASVAVVPEPVPGAPTIGTATGGVSSATVAFTPPVNPGGSPIAGYTVTATDLTTPANGGQTATGATSPIVVSGLTNGDTYTFTVTATNSYGTGLPSSASNTVVPATVPGAPTIGTATAGNASATVAFTPPSGNGGSAVTGYTVTATDLTTPANGGQTATGTTSPIVVSGLTNGDTYTFTVTATNTVGTGPASSASNTVVPATVPGAPTIGTATAGNASATVAFTPPSGNGGSAVTGYTVTATDLTTPANGGQTATGTTSPIVVSGLTNGDTYTFTVTATNTVGTGPASSASNTVVPATVPGAPTIGTATAGNASATVAFTPPSGNGGSAVTGYTVAATDLTTPANGGQTATGATSPIVVSGLTNGDTYTFTVTATNTVGTGLPSSASNTVVPATVPGAPTIGTATAGNASATVAFTPPSGNGGSAVTGYTVTATDLTTPANGGQTATGSSSPIVVSGLVDGDSYDFTVTATNAVGTGSASAPSNTIVPLVPIGITSVGPAALAVGASGSFTISGVGFESGATVKVTGPSTKVTDTASSVVVTPTTVTVTLKSAAGTTNGSYSVTVTNPDTTTATCSGCLTVVTAPTLTSMTPSVGVRNTVRTVTLTGTGFATGATVTVPTGTFVANTTVVNSTTITTTLHVNATATPGTGLTMGVSNPGSAGYGKATAALFSILAAATIPAAPTIGTPTAGNGSAVVVFVPPSNDGGSTITSFTVTATDLTTPANGGETASGSSSPITVNGLTDGDTYTFTVTATNAVGTGPASAPSSQVVPSTTGNAVRLAAVLR